MSARSNFGGFLQYEPQHKVLVCKDCQYAIQKSALDSHLLRHKIYRGQRQRLLHAIGKLDLLEPDDVQFPPSTSLPIDNLPVLPGHRCVSPGCGALCTSEKWMKRHWLARHHQAVHGAFDETSAERVHLQTFFRGQKIKYFEVRLPSETASGPGFDTEQSSSDKDFVSENDLFKLNYLHQFTTSTGLTLPPALFQAGWCSQVLEHAFKQPSLMCGVLCIAAYHLHASDEPELNHSHLEKASSLSQQLVRWLEQKRRSFLEDAVSEPTEDAKVGAQLMCFRQLCVWTISEESIVLPAAFLTTFDLKAFISTMRYCTKPNLALDGLVGSDSLSASLKDSTDTLHQSEYTRSDLPDELAEELRTLPFRMAEALPKPASAADFLATVSSLNCLIQCFHLSYNGNSAYSTWRAMDEWFGMIPKPFAEILERDPTTPAALVVLGHWAVLVQRAERHYWFLAGSAVKIMTEIIGKLPQDEAAQKLVSGLVS